MNKYIKLITSVTSIAILFIVSLCAYNSDWYINKTMQIKEENNKQLTKKIKYNYTTHYEDGRLKIRIEFYGIEKDVFDLICMILNENEYLIKLKFSDNEGFKIAEKEILKTAFEYSTNSKGVYIVYASLLMDKCEIRKIKHMDVAYKAYLAHSYNEILESIMKQMYLQLIEG